MELKFRRKHHEISDSPDDECGRRPTERTPAAELGREIWVGEVACHTGGGSKVKGGGKVVKLLEVEGGGDRADDGEMGPELLVDRREYESSLSDS